VSSDENVTAGVTKGVLVWSEEKVKDLVKKFKNRKIAFIKDEEIIESLKNDENNSEFKVFKK
jgi:ribulose 1,5-bisphosphate carboxylase large subunit-like protein